MVNVDIQPDDMDFMILPQRRGLYARQHLQRQCMLIYGAQRQRLRRQHPVGRARVTMEIVKRKTCNLVQNLPLLRIRATIIITIFSTGEKAY